MPGPLLNSALARPTPLHLYPSQHSVQHITPKQKVPTLRAASACPLLNSALTLSGCRSSTAVASAAAPSGFESLRRQAALQEGREGRSSGSEIGQHRQSWCVVSYNRAGRARATVRVREVPCDRGHARPGLFRNVPIISLYPPVEQAADHRLLQRVPLLLADSPGVGERLLPNVPHRAAVPQYGIAVRAGLRVVRQSTVARCRCGTR